MADISPSIQTIFNEAIEQESQEKVSAYLNEACSGDIAKQQRVEALLRAHSEARGFFAGPDRTIDADHRFDDVVQIGTTIGPYKLRERIGEGGMGVVYLADQKTPVRRTVALKIIKPGMDTQEVVARFEAERQALALMNHANVAKVLEAGATEAGRPYFVMELVRGIPITDFCDKHQLGTRARLELFVTVCRAVQHAHQRGIIHRDLKPSNVLVELHDVTGVPKIIDFGVAKAINQELTERSLHTAFSQMIGTPLYMSPEQVELSGLDIDTRSDVYSLGVMLYELLSGTTPFSRETLKTAGYDELRRIIREDEPPRPSDRVTSLAAESRSTISANRKSEPRKLGPLLRGELDWIVMKCLEKDRTRRYESASSLAADAQHYLDDEPVVARPLSAVYRFRKFAHRRRGVLVAVTFVAVSLIAGVGVSLWQAVEANKARGLADQRATDERVARRRAESNLRRGNEAVEILLSRVAEEQLLDEPRFFQLRMALLNDALRINSNFLDENPEDAEAKFETAKAYRRMADNYYHLGDPHKVAEASRQAIRLLERLMNDRPGELRFLQELAKAYGQLSRSRFDGAPVGEFDLDLHRKCLSLQERLAVTSPDDPERLRQISEACQVLGFFLQSSNLQESQELLRRSLAIAAELVKRHPDRLDFQGSLARRHWFLGRMLHNSGNHHEAQQELQAALSASMETLSKAPRSAELRQTQVEILSSLALVCADASDERGLSYAQQAQAGAEQLLEDDPFNSGCVHLVLVARTRVADHLEADGRPDEALSARAKSVEIAKRLYNEVPASAIYSADLANAHKDLANSLRDNGDLKAAVAEYGSAAEVLQHIITKWPEYSEGKTQGKLCWVLEGKNLRHTLCRILVDQAMCHDLLGEFQEGTTCYEKSANLNPDDIWTRELCMRQLFWYANGLWKKGRPEEARQTWAAAIERTRISFDVVPSEIVRWALATAHYRIGHFEESLRLLEESIDFLRSTTPAEDRGHEGDSFHFYYMAMNYASLGQNEEAKQWFDRGVQWDRDHASELESDDRRSRRAICQEAVALLRLPVDPDVTEPPFNSAAHETSTTTPGDEPQQNPASNTGAQTEQGN